LRGGIELSLRKVKLERLLYYLQRITGLSLVIYLFAHLVETSNRIDPLKWSETVSFLDRTPFHLGLMLLVMALAFHGLNGIRLILLENGFLLPRPTQPVYPYRKAISSGIPRILTIFLLLLFSLVALLIIKEFYGVISCQRT